MEHLEYLEFFSEGEIAVAVNFKKDRNWITPRFATPEKIAQLIAWLQENKKQPIYFDDGPYKLTRISYDVEKNKLTLYATAQA